MAIWVIKDGRREGPYEEQDVRELVYEGTYTDVDPAIRDGQLDWTTLGQILDLHRTPFDPSPAAEPPAMPPESPPAGPPPISETEPSPADLSPAPAPPPPVQVTITDFQIPFGSMVLLTVKWVLAMIPALLILGAIAAIFWITFFAFVTALVRH